MRQNRMSTDVVKLDVGDIVDNALNRNYWGKTWNIFDYDGVVITASLYEIDIEHSKIRFKLVARRGKESQRMTVFSVELGRYSKKIIKDRLVRNAHLLVDALERHLGYQTDRYHELTEEEGLKYESLKKEAIEHLDSEEVSDKDIRQAYISKVSYPDFTSEYIKTFEGEELAHIHNQIDLFMDIV